MSDVTTASASSSSFLSVFRPTFWFGRNWKREITESDLPSEIQSLIRQVVSRSRLRRIEKYDVAEELIQHFEDGHRSGIAFDRLADEFGDLESAAMLIRRSKIRNRSLFASAVRKIPSVIACLSVVYLVLLWHFYRGQASPSVNYTAQLNRTIVETPADNKAWPLYRPLWAKHQFIEGAQEYMDMQQHLYVINEETKSASLVRPSDPQWPQAVEVLNKYEELLDAFRKAAKYNSLGLELQPNPNDYSAEDFAALFQNNEDSNYENYWSDESGVIKGSTISILLPHVQKMREAVRLLHVDTRRAVVEGDVNRVIQNFEATLGLANQTTDTPFTISSFVAAAIIQVGIDQMEEVVTENPDFFSEQQLARLQDALNKTDIQSWLDYEGEYLILKDVVQRCYTDDGNGDGRMTAAGLKFLNSDLFSGPIGLTGSNRTYNAPPSNIDWAKAWGELTNAATATSALAPMSLFTCASRRQVMAKAEEFYEEIEADQKLPFWNSKRSKLNSWKDYDDFLEQHQAEYILLVRVLPASPHVQFAIDKTDARKNAVLTALAMYRYRLRNNQWPETKDDLVPEFLDQIPVDIVTGKPLHFKIVNDRPLVYSVGMDHDDDGGAEAVVNGNATKRLEVLLGPKSDDFEGDWILWPMKHPGS